MKSNIPDVSIIITNYNYGKYVSRAIRSCLSQKHCDVEVVVVDDASTDESSKSLTTFKDDINLIINEKNVGVAESSNIGIRAANGQFVMRVAADDFINSDTCYIL